MYRRTRQVSSNLQLLVCGPFAHKHVERPQARPRVVTKMSSLVKRLQQPLLIRLIRPDVIDRQPI